MNSPLYIDNLNHNVGDSTISHAIHEIYMTLANGTSIHDYVKDRDCFNCRNIITVSKYIESASTRAILAGKRRDVDFKNNIYNAKNTSAVVREVIGIMLALAAAKAYAIETMKLLFIKFKNR